METLVFLGYIRDELPVANAKTRIATLTRHFIVGLTFAVVALALFKAGVTGVFGAAAIVFWVAILTHRINAYAYVNYDIPNKTWPCLIKDKEATRLLIGQVKALRRRIKIPLADRLQGIHLEGINDLAKDSLTSSLLKDVDKITKLRSLLEYELQEVKRILRQHGF